MQNKSLNNRIWELDMLRGIALLLMIYFHVIFDMKDIFGYNVSYSSGVNFYLGKASAILFILISGVSCFLSKNNLKRGLKLLGLAMLITAATWLYNPQLCIRFGILHFLALSVMLSPVLAKMNQYLLLLTGTVVISLGAAVSALHAANDYLFVIGIISDRFVSSDYYPLVPWLGVFMYGLAIGRIFYGQRKSIFSFVVGDNIISRVGRRTLLYYIIHQPVILAALAVVQYFKSRA